VKDAPETAPPLDDGRREFADVDGRKYVVRVSVLTMKRLRESLAIDIAKLVEEKFDLFARLTGDPETLVNVLWVTLETQAKAHGLDEDAFAASLLGDCIFEASRVLCLAICDFFPDPRARDVARGVLETAWKVRQKTLQLAAARVAKVLGDVDVEREAATLIGSSTKPPASLGSTRRPTRSGS
jgi:hypothetical protein